MQKSSLKNIDGIIANILSKEASIDEIIAFGEWINESPENRRQARILSEYWEASTDHENLYAGYSFSKNQKHIFGEDKSSGTGDTGRYKKMFFLSIAASFLLIVTGAFYWFMHGFSPTEQYILMAQDGIERFTLPDSSKVVLNKNSRLVYTDRFLAADRVVSLEGEGYFEVAKKQDRKFIVKAGDSQVKVLGTKFNVDARHPEERIVTTLVEGSVVFENKHTQQLMTPNHKLTFYTRSGLVENVRTDAVLSTEWKDNIFRYRSIRMWDLAKQLSERHGVEIIVDKKYGDIKVSGAFREGQTLERILTIMQKSVDYKWKMDDNKIIIY